MVGLVVLGLAGIARHVLSLERKLVESMAIEDASQYSHGLRIFRTLYTSEVVARARTSGSLITHDYLSTPGALPLPITLTKRIGESLNEASGGDVRLYSDYPFPWRTPGETSLDEFQKDALASLRTSPDAPFYRFVENNGQLVIRYATADLMRAACVECHNTHPDSPKTNWSVGDVRGVLEVSRHVEGGTVSARLDLQRTVRQLVGIAIFALIGLAIGIIVLRRSAMRSQTLASETVEANRLLGLEMEQRKNTERQAIAVQKLESLGLLAGGIAHDFNNLLAGILGNAEMAALETAKPAPKQESVRRYIDLILQTGEQTKRLVKQLLTYAGGHAFEKQPVNLSQRIELLAPLLATASRHKANLVLETDPFLPMLMGDPVQLDQVVMNLLTNASDAIETTGGTITIRTGMCTDEDTDPGRVNPTSSQEDDSTPIYLEVEDDGCGLDNDTQSRMFDPFFSTKGTGRGLGLSALQGIVRDHDGSVMVASEVGRGAIVRIEFRGGIPAIRAHHSTMFDGTSTLGFSNILVVDDDAVVRDTTISMLEEKGFTCTAANSGAEAIALIEVQGAAIDAVILDVCMPNERGLTIYNILMQHRPNLPVMFMSGFAVDEGIHDLVSKGQVTLLTKPFTLYELSKGLSELHARVALRLAPHTAE